MVRYIDIDMRLSLKNIPNLECIKHKKNKEINDLKNIDCACVCFSQIYEEKVFSNSHELLCLFDLAKAREICLTSKVDSMHQIVLFDSLARDCSFCPPRSQFSKMMSHNHFIT